MLSCHLPSRPILEAVEDLLRDSKWVDRRADYSSRSAQSGSYSARFGSRVVYVQHVLQPVTAIGNTHVYPVHLVMHDEARVNYTSEMGGSPP